MSRARLGSELSEASCGTGPGRRGAAARWAAGMLRLPLAQSQRPMPQWSPAGDGLPPARNQHIRAGDDYPRTSDVQHASIRLRSRAGMLSWAFEIGDQ